MIPSNQITIKYGFKYIVKSRNVIKCNVKHNVCTSNGENKPLTSVMTDAQYVSYCPISRLFDDVAFLSRSQSAM